MFKTVYFYELREEKGADTNDCFLPRLTAHNVSLLNKEMVP